jgi:uncharacterized protein (TIGR02646 family)
MRAIAKGNEPACLTQHRATAHSNYGNYSGKPALRVALVAEQRSICCYCLSRIVNDNQKIKIEHWQSQTSYPALQLTYANLLGACLGGKNGKPDQQHCDTRKGDKDLMWNPSNPAHAIETRVKYQNDGKIRSDDSAFDDQLNIVLGLNVPFLVNNRKGALASVLKWWQLKRPSPAQVQARIQKIDNGICELEAFSPVAVWFLKRKLAV